MRLTALLPMLVLLACGPGTRTPEVPLSNVGDLEEASASFLGLSAPVEVRSAGGFWHVLPGFVSETQYTLQDVNGQLLFLCYRSPARGAAPESGSLIVGTCESAAERRERTAETDAALALLGSWLTRTYTLDEIAGLSTSQSPCDDVARSVLALTQNPKHIVLVELIACGA